MPISAIQNFPTIEISAGDLHLRQSLNEHAITIYLKHWLCWDVDTREVQVSEQLIHFVEPNGEIVGLKVFNSGIQ